MKPAEILTLLCILTLGITHSHGGASHPAPTAVPPTQPQQLDKPPPGTPLARPVARGYVTNQAQPIASQGSSCTGSVSQCNSLTGGYDYNPFLAGGTRGAAGIKARLNMRGFQYASTIIAPILIAEIKKARLPNINQALPPPLMGCIQVYNLYVSRFRCPQRVAVYPAEPNLIVVAVENLDVGVTGNLGGQINILIPIALFGIVQVNAHQITVRVGLVIDRSPTGGVAIRVATCQASVGYVDVYIQNGGLVGDIANSQFRGQISEMVRKMIPSQLCAQIPSIVNEKLNSKLNVIPQSIALSQLLQVALNAFGISNLIGGGGGQCPASCTKKLAAAAAPKGPSVILAPPTEKTTVLPPHPTPPLAMPTPPIPFPRPSMLSGNSTISNIPVPPRPNMHRYYVPGGSNNAGNSLNNGGTSIVQIGRTVPLQAIGSSRPKQVLDDNVLKAPKLVKPERQQLLQFDEPKKVVLPPIERNPNFRRVFASAPPHVVSSGASINTTSHLLRLRNGFVPVSGEHHPHHHHRTRRETSPSAPSANRSQDVPILQRPKAFAPSPNHVVFADPNNNVCANCPSGGGQNPLSLLTTVLASLDFSKLSNIYLTVQLLQSYATCNDFTVELNGEFSPEGRGGTPFGAYPMQFPTAVGHKMAEILVSDWTVNSLFYHLHRVGFINIRIGPETPKIGELLKTTCSSDDDEGLEDHGVETEESQSVSVAAALTKSDSSGNSTKVLTPIKKLRHKRQDTGSLSDLGICFGDILPAVRERYPNQKIVVVIRTARAPSLLLSSRNGGTASLDFVLNADFYIESTNEKVGTIQVAANVDFTVRTQGNRISAHADITQLQLRDLDGSLGLPQDALDNLGNLGKEVLLKAGNDALERGTTLSVPSGIGGLPINIIDPEVRIVDHALHVAFDFTVTPQALAELSNGGGGGGCNNG
ncbi:lipopolysaccharide-binding protein [Ditylenchus destructor]|nr:lipopolysaccharide-binding protein [Ditylenchus destructor]